MLIRSDQIVFLFQSLVLRVQKRLQIVLTQIANPTTTNIINRNNRINSYGTSSFKTIFGHLSYILTKFELHVHLLLLFLQVLVLQFGVLPSQILVQLSFLHVLFVQLIVAGLYTDYAFVQFFYFFFLLFAGRQTLQIVVQNWVFLYHVLKELELFLREILFLSHRQQLLKFNRFGSQCYFDVFELDSFLFQLFEVPTFFKIDLLSSHILELLYSHMSWSFPPRFEKTFVKRFLIRDKPSLIIYLFLVFYKSLSSNFCLFFFNLFCNQILQSQLTSLLEKLLYVLKFFFTMRQSTQGDFRFIVRFQLYVQSLKIKTSRMKNIIYFIRQHFNFFLQL